MRPVDTFCVMELSKTRQLTLDTYGRLQLIDKLIIFVYNISNKWI